MLVPASDAPLILETAEMLAEFHAKRLVTGRGRAGEKDTGCVLTTVITHITIPSPVRIVLPQFGAETAGLR